MASRFSRLTAFPSRISKKHRPEYPVFVTLRPSPIVFRRTQPWLSVAKQAPRGARTHSEAPEHRRDPVLRSSAYDHCKTDAMAFPRTAAESGREKESSVSSCLNCENSCAPKVFDRRLNLGPYAGTRLGIVADERLSQGTTQLTVCIPNRYYLSPCGDKDLGISRECAFARFLQDLERPSESAVRALDDHLYPRP